MMKRGKSERETGNKGRDVKGELLNNFNKMITKNNKKKIIVGGVIVSVLSFSCVGYFQSKSALASDRGVYKALEISSEAENISTITPYDKFVNGEDINILYLGDESYLGDVVLHEDVTPFIKNTYNSKVKLTNLSENNKSIYEQLNQYINLEDRKFDLVFLCFENNDEREVSKTNFSGIYESILRDLKYNNTSVDIIPVIKHETLVSDTYYQIINGLSKYYNLDLAKVNENVSKNNIHGESLEDFRENYSNTLIEVIENNINNKKEISTEYKEAYYGVTTLFEPYKVTVKGDKKKGFSVSQSRARSDKKNDYIRYKVDGNIVGLGYETNGNGGIIEIYINRVLYRRIDTKSDIEDFKYVLISSNLSGTNEIKIVNSDGGDVTLLGIITSGNNTDSKEVEGLNNILARNTGSYIGKVKDDSLYENAKKETAEKVEEVQKTQTQTRNKKSGSTVSSSQKAPNGSVSNEIKDTTPNTDNSQVIGSTQNNTESSNSENQGSSSIADDNKNQQNGGNSLGNNNHIQNNGGGNNIGNNNTNNTENTIQNNGGAVNNGANSNIGNGGDSLNNSENNTVNNSGDNINNGDNSNNNINNSVNNGGNTQNNSSGNSGNATNNTVSNNGNSGGSSNESNSGGGNIEGQIQENTANSSAQVPESINPVGNSIESIPSE